jgi:cytochrome c553
MPTLTLPARALGAIALSMALPLTAAPADPAAGQAKAAACAACHGRVGVSANPAFPSLAGLGERYLAKQLADYKSGARQNPIMAGQVAALNEQDFANLAAFYAAQQAAPKPSETASPEGRALYMAGRPQDGIPACAACHGPDGHGNAPAGYPALRGQVGAYLEASLKGYRAGTRTNDANNVMRAAAKGLTDADITALTAHIATFR